MLKFKLNWHESRITVSIYQNHFEIASDKEIKIEINNKIYETGKNSKR